MCIPIARQQKTETETLGPSHQRKERSLWRIPPSLRRTEERWLAILRVFTNETGKFWCTTLPCRRKNLKKVRQVCYSVIIHKFLLRIHIRQSTLSSQRAAKNTTEFPERAALLCSAPRCSAQLAVWTAKRLYIQNNVNIDAATNRSALLVVWTHPNHDLIYENSIDRYKFFNKDRVVLHHTKQHGISPVQTSPKDSNIEHLCGKATRDKCAVNISAPGLLVKPNSMT